MSISLRGNRVTVTTCEYYLQARLPIELPTTFKESIIFLMNDSNPAKPRPVLKLKTSTRKPSPKVKASPQPQSKASQKPGAALSDELKRRMQEDMDALISR